ncbi:ArsR/SmtB family transcription factor [Dactylosporangium sp. CA-092794]|uniref:ArsR/SmtB family transcription factor n=1 Tax=Dactylosporangium sp. CA-092794 TaxID=3239929 RepID=UPI003D8B4C36
MSDDRAGPGPAAGTSDDLFRVLADPTRRRILDLLADRGTLTVSELAGHFPDLVASGISKHLMALRATGLVTATRQGRNQLYAIDADAMSQALAPWLARYEAYWTGALARLRAVATEPAEGDAAEP